MTTIILMKTDKAVYLASDSQVSQGNLKLPDDFEKVLLMGDSLIATCGSVGLCQKVSSRAYKNLKENFIESENYESEPDVKDFAREISNINFYLPLEFKTFHSAGFLLGGIADGELKGYSVGDDGSKLEIKKYACDGSGSQIALGLLQELYKPDFDLEVGASKVGYCVYSASRSDIYTNSKVRVLAITKEGEVMNWDFTAEDVKPKEEKKECS